MDPKTKRRYNLTYLARKSGFVINSRKKQVVAYFEDLTKIVQNNSASSLIKEYNYTVTENRQLKMKI